MTEQSQDANGSRELQEVLSAPDLPSVQTLLRKQMASQRIQVVIKSEGLLAIANRILELAREDASIELLAGAALARLAAVARTREKEVLDLLPTLFTTVPQSIETLATGDDKVYAATSLRHCSGHWVKKYCLSEALVIHTAEEARRELLDCGLTKTGALSKFLRELELNSESVRQISTAESRLKRVRRILTAV